MKISNLSLAILIALGTAACGGSGSSDNKPADPQNPSNPNTPSAPSELADLLTQLADSWHESNTANPHTLYVGGQALLMEADPYGQLEHFKRVYETLEEQVSILQVLHDALKDADPAVRIGEELPLRELAPYAVVATKYEATDSSEGHLGILGPTRMDYGATLDAVQVVADVLSRTIGSMTGSGSVMQSS